VVDTQILRDANFVFQDEPNSRQNSRTVNVRVICICSLGEGGECVLDARVYAGAFNDVISGGHRINLVRYEAAPHRFNIASANSSGGRWRDGGGGMRMRILTWIPRKT